MRFTTGDTSLLSGTVNVDVSGGSTLELHIAKPDGVKITRNASVVNAATGEWQYRWAANELDVNGLWYVECQVTFPDTTKATFGPAAFRVVSEIA